ncbi:amidohydrolase family protein [Actinokineospora sp. NBRC 105648]|uniref:amidohydrolase family protein n=1 Tax=Actinokineospora sp. NBRC 105648 TaxID=3032206 RepID=UPI0024A4F1F5|nr:amidohydrolase family protein [Actinokineospora sp. NBRC 105648]GLZ36635.1 amidohydrolase [Actinokineospora sp. NBRC 105648]
MLEISGKVLPGGEDRVIVIAGERISSVSPTAGTDLWLVPGLVDVHTHPGTEKPGDTFDNGVFRDHMLRHRASGVLLVRMPGSAETDSTRVFDDADLPRVVPGGRWLATLGKFFPGYGRDIADDELVTAAVEEAAASGGWCKIIGDWVPGAPVIPLEVLTDAVTAVHAIGGRVAVHSQTTEGGRNAVLAGADSIEHGMHLDHELLPRMAEQGTALVPTFTTFAKVMDDLKGRDDVPEDRRTWLTTGWEGLFATARAAHEAGVTVLAGTDSSPFGAVADEVEWLVRAGLPRAAAVGAASWTARSWLGLPGIEAGAPADIVAYDADPRVEPDVLRRPKQVVLRGELVG